MGSEMCIRDSERTGGCLAQDLDGRIEVDPSGLDAFDVGSESDEPVTSAAPSVGFDETSGGDGGVSWLDPNRLQCGGCEFDQIVRGESLRGHEPLGFPWFETVSPVAP